MRWGWWSWQVLGRPARGVSPLMGPEKQQPPPAPVCALASGMRPVSGPAGAAFPGGGSRPRLLGAGAALDEGDLVARLIVVDQVHEGADEHQAAAGRLLHVGRVRRVRQLERV